MIPVIGKLKAGMNILLRNKELFQVTISKNDQLFQKSCLMAIYAFINEYIGRRSFLPGFCHIILTKKVEVGLPLLGPLAGIPTR